ncbi:MAG TPA: DNA-binding protein [Phycisphaerales bacterium]|nr:DNA-binding protein [Phycisphaerales bacterium]
MFEGNGKILTVREAAKFLRLSERMLWELTKRGKIVAIRVGRRVTYDIQDLLAWVERQKVRLATVES